MRYVHEDITERTTFTHRGASYVVLHSNEERPYHPSLWSHMDEVETREEWWRIEPGDVVFDVGADFGSYTLPALAHGATVDAWSPPFKLAEEAFEAKVLELVAQENQFSGRLEVHTTGLYDRDGWMAAFDGPRAARVFDTEEEARAAISGQDGHCSVFKVEPMNAWLPWHGPDWLKIDTEGCELAILRGGESLLRACLPKIILEHHYHIDPECETKCDAYLESLGYERVGRRPHHSIAHSLYLHRKDTDTRGLR